MSTITLGGKQVSTSRVGSIATESAIPQIQLCGGCKHGRETQPCSQLGVGMLYNRVQHIKLCHPITVSGYELVLGLLPTGPGPRLPPWQHAPCKQGSSEPIKQLSRFVPSYSMVDLYNLTMIAACRQQSLRDAYLAHRAQGPRKSSFRILKREALT